MDNNLSESDDERFVSDDEIIDVTPFPPKCPNEIVGIDSLSICFQKRYAARPLFSVGTLRKAFHEAFSPTQIEERRPLLIYIHNDENLLSKTFCKNIFCSTRVIEYLLDHYIVWPWDITYQSNRNTLTNIWEEMFSAPFSDDFSIEQCPLLIGIQQMFKYEIDGLVKTEYQFKSLLQCDIVTRTQKKNNREILLNELRFFKKEYDENEKFLTLGFVKIFGLCWEIILEIVKYLSLNDAISAFSPLILSLLNDPELRFQLSNPSVPFLRMVHQKFHPEQIVSLKLTANRLWSKSDLSIFTNVISLTLLNLSYENPINQYAEDFPNLTFLSLWYDNEINFSRFHSIFNQLWNQIKRLEIHSAGVLCIHYDVSQFYKLYEMNNTIEYFVLDVGHFPLIPMNNCFGNYNSCFLRTIIHFIKTMRRIRYIQLIINQYDIEQLLILDQWENLINECLELKKITLKVLGNILQNEQSIQKVLIIQEELSQIRQTIEFQIKFL